MGSINFGAILIVALIVLVIVFAIAITILTVIKRKDSTKLGINSLNKPILCPHCGSRNISFVTEYHKAIFLKIARNACFIIPIVLIICDFIWTIQNALSTNPAYRYVSGWETPSFKVVIILFAIAAAVLSVLAYLKETKTHVQSICRDCGHLWLLN